MKTIIINMAINILGVVGVVWVLYRIFVSFQVGLINGMVHIIVLGASTWLITYLWQYYGK